LFLLLKEPVRLGPSAAAPQPLREVVKIVLSRSTILLPIFSGLALVNLTSYTFFIWTPAFLQRTYQYNSAQVGVTFGLILLIFGTAGVYCAGALSDWLTERGHGDAPLKVAAFGFVGCGLFGGLAPLMPPAAPHWPCLRRLYFSA
jgi:hypothetical protein